MVYYLLPVHSNGTNYEVFGICHFDFVALSLYDCVFCMAVRRTFQKVVHGFLLNLGRALPWYGNC